MSIGAELGQYILQIHNSKNSEDSMGGGLNPFNPSPVLGTPVICSSHAMPNYPSRVFLHCFGIYAPRSVLPFDLE